MSQPIAPIRSTTQVFTEIEDVDRDIVLFCDGSCALIIATSAVNFGLLSEKEQDAIIYAYAGFLNSLSFPIQLLIQTRHKDISAYLSLLEEQEQKQKSPKLAESIHKYRSFVATTVKERDVLDKKFYIIVPFSAIELGLSARSLLGGKKQGLPYQKPYIFERALTALTPRRDHILRLLARVGLQAHQLTSDQIVRLFFSVYNPEDPAPEIEKPEKLPRQET
ncbi:hypothetical protein KKB64_00115 [Patescibacteria group bacterium]|nr:hypothetical protein [Patescibacteria group bacterium]MBU1472179.1 hypothetical protein [Patescibacteria group bacterium]MBU2459573.1 hypothetical protein [Patescibacteria group bacterium]MBU2544186.1 hypothetical protein [Patescibacteria group bacterium]